MSWYVVLLLFGLFLLYFFAGFRKNFCVHVGDTFQNSEFVLSAELCLPYEISSIPMLLSTHKSSWSIKKGKKIKKKTFLHSVHSLMQTA